MEDMRFLNAFTGEQIIPEKTDYGKLLLSIELGPNDVGCIVAEGEKL